MNNLTTSAVSKSLNGHKLSSRITRFTGLLGACAVLSQAKLPAAPLDKPSPVALVSTQSVVSSEPSIDVKGFPLTEKQLIGIGILMVGTAIQSYSLEKRARGNLPGTLSIMTGAFLLGSGPLVFASIGSAAGALVIGYLIGSAAANRQS
jgi:hypothetical protein